MNALVEALGVNEHMERRGLRFLDNRVPAFHDTFARANRCAGWSFS
jgi:hypothetical protein